jgi:hypothetical protein
VRNGFARTFGQRVLSDPRVLSRRGERWRPYRSVGAFGLRAGDKMCRKNSQSVGEEMTGRLSNIRSRPCLEETFGPAS